MTTELGKDKNSIVVKAAEGYVLTTWDEQDIMDYTFAKIMYCPLTFDVTQIREITDEESEKLLEEQLKQIELTQMAH